MERNVTTRMLGCADYEARWIDNSMVVKITARGFLPCANHQAQLEKKAGSICEMVFYTQECCVESYTPFSLQAIVVASSSSAFVTVIDALGEHQLAIQPAEIIELEPETEEDMGPHMVYIRQSATEIAEEAYFTVPASTNVLPIFIRAYGPASKRDCAAFIASGNEDFLDELEQLHLKIRKVEDEERAGH